MAGMLGEMLSTSFTAGDRAVNFLFYLTEHKQHRHLLGRNWIYEPEIIGAMINYVRPGDVCIDAGANLGYHSLILSRLVGDNGIVFALDADPDCVKKCRANLALNNADVCLLETALWDEDGDLGFNQSSICGYSSVLAYSDVDSERIVVHASKLDSIFSHDKPIRLLKIDCEGAEERILRGATQLLERGIDCVLVELNFDILPRVHSSERRIRELMGDLGYRCYVLYPNNAAPRLIPRSFAIEPVGAQMFNVLFSRGSLPDWQSWSYQLKGEYDG